MRPTRHVFVASKAPWYTLDDTLPRYPVYPGAETGGDAACASSPAMLHHVSLGTTDLSRSARFYDAVLAALGLGRVWTADTAIGYGPPGGGDQLAIKLQNGPLTAPGPGFHLAFAAPDQDTVSAFHTAALAYGGTDNGAPGLRPHYGDGYYAAFVIDPDGHRLEAVLRRPDATRR